MEWTSVKDKLPAEEGFYLVCAETSTSSYKNGNMMVCLIEDGVWWCGTRIIKDVTYWTELPEQPKKPMNLRDKVLFGLSHINNAGTNMCPSLYEQCREIGCPYVGTDCELEILADAYKLIKGDEN